MALWVIIKLIYISKWKSQAGIKLEMVDFGPGPISAGQNIPRQRNTSPRQEKHELRPEWMNPTCSWDWQLLCYKHLILLDADGGRTHWSSSHESDGFTTCVDLTQTNLDMRLKKKYGSRMIDTLHVARFRSLAAYRWPSHQRFMCSNQSEGIYLTLDSKESSLIMTVYI